MAFWIPLLIFVATTALSMLLRPKTPKPPTTLPEAPDEDTTLPIPVVFGTQRVPMRWVRLDAQGMIQSTRGVYSFGIKVGKSYLAQHWWFQGSALLTYGEISSFGDIIFDDRFWLSDLAGKQHVTRIITGFESQPLSGGALAQVPSISIETVNVFAQALNFGLPVTLPYLPGASGGALFGLILPDLYGGDEKSGGVGGYLTMRFGQRYPDLPARLGGPAPAAGRDHDAPPWRPFTWVDFGLGETDAAAETVLARTRFMNPRWFRNGVTAYPPPLEFVVTRLPVGPVGGRVGNFASSGDANPVTAIWELLTNADIGLGMPEWMLDTDSFHTAALVTGAGQSGTQTTNVNFFGVSFTLDQERTGEDVIGALLETLDAVLYTDLTTGKLAIWLIREPTSAEYGYGSLAALPALTPSNARLVRWSLPQLRELPNVIRVKYRDRQRKFTEAVHVERNVAAITAIDREQSLTIEPLGIATRVIAERVAKRELRARSTRLRRATFEVTRAHPDLHVGKQFLAAFPDRGLADVVMRVVQLDWGTPDDPTVRIEAAEDVYGRPALFTLTDPDPAPPDVFPFFRTPVVEEMKSATATHGALYLNISDPDALVTALTWQTKSGADDWVTDIPGDLGDPVIGVPLSINGESAIAYRVLWVDPGGTEHEIDGLVEFGSSAALIPRVVFADFGAGPVPITSGDAVVTSTFT